MMQNHLLPGELEGSAFCRLRLPWLPSRDDAAVASSAMEASGIDALAATPDSDSPASSSAEAGTAAGADSRASSSAEAGTAADATHASASVPPVCKAGDAEGASGGEGVAGVALGPSASVPSAEGAGSEPGFSEGFLTTKAHGVISQLGLRESGAHPWPVKRTPIMLGSCEKEEKAARCGRNCSRTSTCRMA